MRELFAFALALVCSGLAVSSACDAQSSNLSPFTPALQLAVVEQRQDQTSAAAAQPSVVSARRLNESFVDWSIGGWLQPSNRSIRP